MRRPYGGATYTRFTLARNMRHALIVRVVEIEHISDQIKNVTANEMKVERLMHLEQLSAT